MTAAVTMSLAVGSSASAPDATYPPQVPPSNPPRTAVDPLDLSRGPDPRVVYYDQRRHVIHDGARVAPAQFPGTVTKLVKVVGYVVDSEGGMGACSGWSPAAGSPGSWRGSRTTASSGWCPPTYRSDRMSRAAADPVSQAALDVDRLAVSRDSGRPYMTSLGSPGGPSWSWPYGQPAGRFSPNGRRILTLTPQPGARYDGAYVAIRVRGTTHGRIAGVLTGRFGVESYPQDPRWETSSTFLSLALAPPNTDNVNRMAWVRCTVGGSCENASPVFRVATGSSPWVLADQPTH